MLEVFIALGFVPRPPPAPLTLMAAQARHTINRPPTEMDAPMTPHRPAFRRLKRLAAFPLTLLALALPSSALAANALDPLCQLQDGSVLFFTESTRACPNATASCRETFWSYATLSPKGAGQWTFDALGSARLDESASAQQNAQSARQRFDAPAAHPCAAFFRADRLPSPDLPDAEGWFRYSFEKGQLLVHWKTLKRALPLQARWDIDFCQQGCGAQGPGLRATLVDKKRLSDIPASDPAFDLRLDDVALLGFSPSGVKSDRVTRWMVSVPLSSLKKAQAELLHKDALSFSQSARDDLLGAAMVAGLYDAALQLDPDNRALRLDYARHFAGQADAASAVRELKLLPASADLKASLAKDAAFDPIRAAAAFQQFLSSL